MLQEGDVIELKAGMKVYADIPKHFVYSNCRGDFSMTHNDITLGGQFDYLVPNNDNSCVAWSHEGERWQIDRFPSHWWWGDEPAPNNACTRQVAGCASSEVLSTPVATCG